MGLDAGSRIAQYRLERKLGAGGMGEVYLARDESLDRFVALKLLTANDESARKRLVREARAAAGLDHPGICAVYEVGSDPVAGDFIAMQYIEGETLAARLQRGRMSPDEAMNIGAQIAEALVAAHKHGLVHRDLKPQNIIITPSGSARLLDFGLAQHVPSAVEAANATTSSRVTDPNMVLGTPSYMSPEQVRNEPADLRTDVFALGCVLYECLTGRRAFSGATTAEVLGAILHVDPPPVSSVVPNVGPAYDALCARLLDKNPSERFHSAEEALGAIRALTPSAHFSTRSLRVPARAPRGRFAQIAVIAALVIGGAFAWKWYRSTSLPLPTPDAESWYQKGVEAMRDGAFLGARNAFARATELFPGYAQAYSRLAEAETALDDEEAAKAALVEVSRLAPNRSRWPRDEQLRFDAASAASLRKYGAAVAAYQQLVNLKQNDAGRWLDLGRALENNTATPRSEALSAYQKAVDLDNQNAAAHLRLGVMLPRLGKVDDGLTSIEQAIRLYRLGQREEGEVEAMLRKAIVLADTRQRNADAQAGFEEVIRLSAGGRFPAQNIRARFNLAKLKYNAGLLTEAESAGREAVDAAAEANLRTLSATGLADLSLTVSGLKQYQEADGILIRAISIAKERGATRVEMRAKLYLAGLKYSTGKIDEGIALSNEALKYFAATEDARLLADSKNQLARGYEYTERYSEARSLTEQALQFAEGAKDNAALANALENLAGQLTKLGNLPEALKYRQQLTEMNRSVPTDYSKHLANTAELLILLGRRPEADVLLRELDLGIASKLQPYIQRQPRVAQLRVLEAAIDRRWSDVISGTSAVERLATNDGGKTPDVVVFSRILAEYAKAQQAISSVPAATLAAWSDNTTSPTERRDRIYWVALTLLQRGEFQRAETMAGEALAAPGLRDNPELGWRLAAVAKTAARLAHSSNPPELSNRKNVSPSDVEAAWGDSAKSYFARPDLAALRREVR